MWPRVSEAVGLAEAAGSVEDQQIRSKFPSLGNKTQKAHKKNSGLRIFSIVSLFVSSMNCFQTKTRIPEGVKGGVVVRALFGQSPPLSPRILANIPIHRAWVTRRQALYTFTKHLHRIFENRRGCSTVSPERYINSFNFWFY